jgi:putative oxidoreductase
MERLKSLLDNLNALAPWFAPLVLRLLLAKEFWDAGIEKMNSNNWFYNIQAQFPFPFSLLPPDTNWQLAISFEVLGAVALLLGFGTRFFAMALSLLTLIAIFTIHADAGYTLGSTINEGGWKLPLFYLVMLMTLILSGPGKLSIDHHLYQRHMKTQRRLWS